MKRDAKSIALEKTISRRLKVALFEAGMSCRELARKTGSSPNTIFLLVNAGCTPRADTLVKIADVLECSVDWLLGRAKQQRRYD
jgi:transcriptional regulator with XRE-family HTH domain